MGDIRRYTAEEYKGEFNLLKMERDHILRVYRIARGHKGVTAQILGINVRSLFNKIESHNISKEMQLIDNKLKNRNNVESKTN